MRFPTPATFTAPVRRCARLARQAAWLLPVIALAVAFSLGSASSAVASCGDYLSHGGLMPGGHVSLRDDLPSHQAPIQQAPLAPCNGPTCQRAPVVPPAPVAPSVPLERSSDWLISLSEVLGASERRWFGFGVAADERPLSGYPDSLEEPPRFDIV
jgi:hypothetical protein